MSLEAHSWDPGKEGEDSDSDTGSDLGADDAAAFLSEDTILIFDWDDTVLPSTWIQEHGFDLDECSVPDTEQQVCLQMLADRAAETLSVAKHYGKVVLVTNAEHGWIELSCQKFMPSLYPMLQDVKILSARTTYEKEGVDSPFQWKYLAFESEIGGFCKSLDAARWKNVISLGDSAHEREALIRVTERLENCCMKSLKFVEQPEVEQLSKEHELLRGVFSQIVHYKGNLDLCIRCP